MMLAFFFLLLSSLYSASFQLLICIFTPSKQHLYTFQTAYLYLLNILYPAYSNKSSSIKPPIVRLICFILLLILHQKTKINIRNTFLIGTADIFSCAVCFNIMIFRQTAIKQYYLSKIFSTPDFITFLRHHIAQIENQ